MDWKSLVLVIANAVLRSNPKTAPIANEVSTGIVDAESLFTKGSDKKGHVLDIAVNAAQSVDELRGGVDDVKGHVGNAVDHIITAVNEVQAGLMPSSPSAPAPSTPAPVPSGGIV